MHVQANESLKGGQEKARTVIMQREDVMIEVFWYSGDDMEQVTGINHFKALKKHPHITREATGFWALRGKRY